MTNVEETNRELVDKMLDTLLAKNPGMRATALDMIYENEELLGVVDEWLPLVKSNYKKSSSRQCYYDFLAKIILLNRSDEVTDSILNEFDYSFIEKESSANLNQMNLYPAAYGLCSGQEEQMSKFLWMICCDNCSENNENLCVALTNLKYLTIAASEEICSLIDENMDLFMDMI